MTERIQHGSLAVDQRLNDFIETKALPNSGVSSDQFWASFEQIIQDLTPKNDALLAKRDDLQAQIDQWHRDNQPFDAAKYKAFLQDIGYLVPEGEDFQVSTENVDEEIATLAGPQLVVPVRNARYALNAANARWGSLYDALYGTDAIDSDNGAEKGQGYNPVRGARVIAFAKNFLNATFPLAQGDHTQATGYAVDGTGLTVTLQGGATTGLQDPSQFSGYTGEASAPTSVLLRNNGLHVEIQFDASHTVGKILYLA